MSDDLDRLLGKLDRVDAKRADKIRRLEEQQKQTIAELEAKKKLETGKLKAQKRAEAEKLRKRDTRRKILLGGVMQKWIRSGALNESAIAAIKAETAQMSKRDRELFGYVDELGE